MPVARRYELGMKKLLPPIPEVLYKYRDFEKGMKILSERTIFFSHPEIFNDLFDCDIPVRFDLLTDDEFDELSIMLLMKLSGMTQSEARPHYYKHVKGNPKFRQASDRDAMVKWQLDNLKDNVRVFCMAKEQDDILMWAHYSDSHRGLCIGLNREHLYYNTGASFVKIEYHKFYPELKPSAKDENYYIAQVCSKADNWNYEKEFRLVHFGKTQVFDIDPKAIESVVVGCAAKPETIAVVQALLKSDQQLNHVKLYKAEKVAHSFALTVVPVS